MKIIEFRSQVRDGKISVPGSAGLKEGQLVRVVVYADDAASVSAADTIAREEFWKRTEGSWQGEPLVREDQGDYPDRLELE